MIYYVLSFLAGCIVATCACMAWAWLAMRDDSGGRQ